jgi:hypothetical protein
MKEVKPIYKKMLKVMEAITNIEKKGRNNYDHYSYATEADIKAVVRKELIKNKIIFKHEIVREKTRGDIVNGKMNVLVRIKVKYAFIDVETGDIESGTYYGHGTDKGDKGLYKAITGSIKYILTSTFLIPTGDDPEDAKDEEPFKGDEYADDNLNVAPPLSERIAKYSDMEKLKYLLNKMGGNSESSALLLLGEKTGLKFNSFKEMTKTQTSNAFRLLSKLNK